jgi:predicted DNA binding CopG/RHH family protein
MRVFPDPAHAAVETRYLGIGTTDATSSSLSRIGFSVTSDLSAPSAPGSCTPRRSNIIKRKAKTRAKLPRLKTDSQAEQFVANSDLTQFDLSAPKPTRFEFAPKEARINMRLPGELLSAVKRAAKRRGVPYQRFIRQTLEDAIKESRS